jgi:hypothetical protein
LLQALSLHPATNHHSNRQPCCSWFKRTDTSYMSRRHSSSRITSSFLMYVELSLPLLSAHFYIVQWNQSSHSISPGITLSSVLQSCHHGN